AVEHGRAQVRVRLEQKVLEPPAIDLERGDRREIRRADLDPLGEIPIVAVREEVPQAELLEVLGPEMQLEAQPLLKIVGADLDARLAHLERGLRNRMRPLLDDEHPQRRRFLTQLPRETSTS